MPFGDSIDEFSLSTALRPDAAFDPSARRSFGYSTPAFSIVADSVDAPDDQATTSQAYASANVPLTPNVSLAPAVAYNADKGRYYDFSSATPSLALRFAGGPFSASLGARREFARLGIHAPGYDAVTHTERPGLFADVGFTAQDGANYSVNASDSTNAPANFGARADLPIPGGRAAVTGSFTPDTGERSLMATFNMRF